MKKAQDDFNKLKDMFEVNKHLSYDDMAKVFNGFNLDGELFDFNFESLTATIIFEDGKPRLSNTVDYYESEDSAPVSYTFTEGE